MTTRTVGCGALLALSACGAPRSLPPAVPVTTASAGQTSPSAPGVTVTNPDSPPDSSAPLDTVAAPTASPWASVTGNLAGLESECGNLSGMSVRPDKDVVIAGVALRGLWASIDGSAEWIQIGTNSNPPVEFRLSSIVYDPERPDTFWVSGLYHGPGVLRTDDGGNTFVRLGDVPMSDLVSVDLTDPFRRTLLAASHESKNLYASNDGGETWAEISAGLPENTGYSTSPLVLDAQTFLLGTTASEGSGIFRTTDGGLTWQPVFSGAISGAPVMGADGSITFGLAGAGVVVSEDQGTTWNATGSPGSGAVVDLPGDALAAIGPDGVVVSPDGGGSWVRVGEDLPFDANGLVYSDARHAFYAWHFDCGFDGPIPVADGSIMRMDVDLSPLLG